MHQNVEAENPQNVESENLPKQSLAPNSRGTFYWFCDDSEEVRIRAAPPVGGPPARGRLSQAGVPARQVRPLRCLQRCLSQRLHGGIRQEPVL